MSTPFSNLTENQFSKTELRQDAVDYDQLSATKISNAKGSSEINDKCELQLDNANFQKLKLRLKDHLKIKLGSKEEIDKTVIDNYKKNIKNGLQAVYSKVKVTGYVDNIKAQVEQLNAVGDNALALGTKKNINKLVEDSAPNKTEELENVIKSIKKSIEDAKKAIDDLNGGILSKGAFFQVDADVELLKKYESKKRDYIKTINLTKSADDKDLSDADMIKGKLYTSKWRFSNKNLQGVDCTVTKVDAKDKVYTVKYSGGEFQVKQSDVCLVSNSKFNEKPETSK